jgi:LemA protein
VEIVCIVVGGIVLIWLLATWNAIRALEQRSGQSWANVDVLLKKRADLIPNLVAAVRGYLKHEHDVLERVVELRAQALSAHAPGARLEAEGQISRLLPRLFMQFEAYPNLRGNQNVMHLQRELVSLETQIADRRETYNAVVAEFSIARKTIPGVLFARAFWPEDIPFFEADLADRAVPQVSL